MIDTIYSARSTANHDKRSLELLSSEDILRTTPDPSASPESAVALGASATMTGEGDDERPQRRLTFAEALLQLRPEADYTLEEALSSLDPDEYDGDSSSEDSDTISFILTSSERSAKANGSRSHRIMKDISQYLKQIGLWQYFTLRPSP